MLPHLDSYLDFMEIRMDRQVGQALLACPTCRCWLLVVTGAMPITVEVTYVGAAIAIVES